MKDKPEACKGCPAYTYGLGFVPPTNPRRTEFAVVGQGPGQQEAIFGAPFHPQAPSGRMLRGWLHAAGIDERTVAMGNAICCWTPQVRINGELGKSSRDPTPAEVEHCWKAHVGPWLHQLPGDTHVLAVGAFATRLLLGLPHKSSVTQLTGITQPLELPK